MMRTSVRRTLTFLAFTTFVPVLVMGCPKKEPVVDDAGAPPPPVERADGDRARAPRRRRRADARRRARGGQEVERRPGATTRTS